MKGLEISKKYFEEFGEKILRDNFSDILPFLACGLTGSGSECFGYDDDISRDHDFEPGFCIFIPDESVVDRKTAFRLERAYAQLPKEFMGVKRQLMAPVGGQRHGVFRINEYYEEKLGAPDCRFDIKEWFTLPEEALAESVNGEIFFDNYGLITDIRNRISFYPSDIKMKKLAGHLLLMAQSGQYNYSRCMAHGETGAAQLSLFEFAKSAISAVFLLNGKYKPFYKWSFRALRSLEILPRAADYLEFLISSDNSKENTENKQVIIETTASEIIDELTRQNLTSAICGDLEKHAYSVNDKIENAEIRNMHILSAV